MRPIVVAAFIAFPTGWWIMTQWLEGFAYRVTIAWWIFAVAGGTALVIAFATVSVEAIRAAIANPVKSLRSE